MSNSPFPRYFLIERLTNEDGTSTPDIIEMLNDYDKAIENVIWYNSRGRDIEIYELKSTHQMGIGWCKKGASA